MTRALLCLVLAACGSSKAAPPAEAPAEQSRTAEPARPPEMPAATTPAAADNKSELVAKERAAFDRAKPVFDKWCAKCHTKTGKNASPKKLEHFDMTTYPFAGHHAGAISSTIRKVLGVTGKKVTMPSDKKGAVQGDELELIKAWADAWDASHAGSAHEHHH